jgi:hypothetical protein
MEQVSRLLEGLKAGEDPEELQKQVEVRPHDPVWDLHLIRLLEKADHPAVPGVLTALFAHSPDKARQKALRRALHVMKSRGVPVAPDLLPREEGLALTSGEPPRFEGYMSPLWGHGESFVFLEGPREVMDGNCLVARLQDEEGFRECHLLDLSRRQREEMWQELERDGLGPMVKAPPAYVLQLLEEHLALTPEGAAGAKDYLPVREILWRHLRRPAEEFSPEELLGPLTPEERRRFLEESPQLVNDELFRSWLPGWSDISPWREKLKAAGDSPLILSEHQQRQRLEGIRQQAVQALFPPASRPLWGRRLLRMAVFFHFMGNHDHAQAARVAGEDLLSGERGPLSGENPFLEELVIKALFLAEILARREEGEEQPSSGLILPPDPSLFRSR